MRKLVAAALLICISCGKSETGNKYTTIYPESDAVDGGTLIVGVNGEPEALNPLTTLLGFGHEINGLIYSGLGQINPDLRTYKPDLAKSWEISEDGSSITFHLRTDVSWHDGRPFSSRDVVFSFDMQTDPEILWSGIDRKEGIHVVESPDDSTVVFRFKAPSPTMLSDALEGLIVPEHLLGGLSANALG